LVNFYNGKEKYYAFSVQSKINPKQNKTKQKNKKQKTKKTHTKKHKKPAKPIKSKTNFFS